MNELVAATKKLGVFPFTNFNRMHVVPPCNVSKEEALEGIAVLDQAFATISHHYTGADS
jgi:taurine--2-oxoglutarate transaminase